MGLSRESQTGKDSGGTQSLPLHRCPPTVPGEDSCHLPLFFPHLNSSLLSSQQKKDLL